MKDLVTRHNRNIRIWWTCCTFFSSRTPYLKGTSSSVLNSSTNLFWPLAVNPAQSLANLLLTERNRGKRNPHGSSSSSSNKTTAISQGARRCSRSMTRVAAFGTSRPIIPLRIWTNQITQTSSHASGINCTRARWADPRASWSEQRTKRSMTAIRRQSTLKSIMFSLLQTKSSHRKWRRVSKLW